MRRRLAFLLLLFCLALGALMAGCAATRRDAAQLFARALTAALGEELEGSRCEAPPLVGARGRAAGGGSNAHIEAAQRLSRHGRAADAVNFLDAALRRKELSWDPMLWAALSDAAAKLGDTARAKQAGEEAARRADMIAGATAAGKGGRDAVARLLQAGLYYERREDKSRAVAALREALRRAPGDPSILNNLGYVLADKGDSPADFAEALRLTRQAVRRAPREPIILDSYGWALYKAGKLREARRVLREAADAAPGEPEIRYHLGVVYRDMGLVEEANNELSRALLLEPSPELRRDTEKARGSLRKPPGQGVVHDT